MTKKEIKKILENEDIMWCIHKAKETTEIINNGSLTTYERIEKENYLSSLINEIYINVNK